MWGRPVRQATAHAKPVHGAPVGAALDVLVHRNELNEQQRPGQLVLVPLKQATGGSSRWSAKLLRNMKCKEDGATITACEGLLFYTGEQINHDDLDPKGIIPMALKKACVCFITNQVDSADSGSGMVSGMKGTPVEVGPDGSLVDIRTRVVLRGPYTAARTRAVGDSLEARDSRGSWYKARVVAVRGEGTEQRVKVHFQGWAARWDEWAGAERLREAGSDEAEMSSAGDEDEDSAEEHHESYFFGGYVAFEFKTLKNGKAIPDVVRGTLAPKP